MATITTSLTAFRELVEEAAAAIEADYRISETIAYAAGSLQTRQRAKSTRILLKNVESPSMGV